MRPVARAGRAAQAGRDPRVRALSPYYEVIEDVHRSVLSPPPVTAWPAVSAVLSSAIADVVRGRAESGPALGAAATRIEAEGWLS